MASIHLLTGLLPLSFDPTDVAANVTTLFWHCAQMGWSRFIEISVDASGEGWMPSGRGSPNCFTHPTWKSVLAFCTPLSHILACVCASVLPMHIVFVSYPTESFKTARGDESYFDFWLSTCLSSASTRLMFEECMLPLVHQNLQLYFQHLPRRWFHPPCSL